MGRTPATSPAPAKLSVDLHGWVDHELGSDSDATALSLYPNHGFMQGVVRNLLATAGGRARLVDSCVKAFEVYLAGQRPTSELFRAWRLQWSGLLGVPA